MGVMGEKKCQVMDIIVSNNALSQPNKPQIKNRRNFVKETMFLSFSSCSPWCAMIQPNVHASAIEFIPASPSFKYSYQDGIEILATQRVACDNIITVVSDGNLNEAAFKIMQLNAQTKVGGKIVLDSIQTHNLDLGESKKDGRSNGTADAVNTLKLLRCQEKFATLLDLSGECEILISKALNGNLGATAPAQLKLLANIKDVINAFDEFLLEFVEDSFNTSL